MVADLVSETLNRSIPVERRCHEYIAGWMEVLRKTHLLHCWHDHNNLIFNSGSNRSQWNLAWYVRSFWSQSWLWPECSESGEVCKMLSDILYLIELQWSSLVPTMILATQLAMSVDIELHTCRKGKYGIDSWQFLFICGLLNDSLVSNIMPRLVTVSTNHSTTDAHSRNIVQESKLGGGSSTVASVLSELSASPFHRN